MSDNPLLDDAVDRVMVELAGAFDRLWSRPDAAQLLVQFVEGEITFHVRHDGIAVLRVAEGASS